MPLEHSTYQNHPAASLAVLAFALMFSLFLILVSYAITAYLLARLFKKAGVETWKAWVPVYQLWVLLQLGDQQGFWVILLFIPPVSIVGLVFLAIAMYQIGVKLGKSGWFVLLAIFPPTTAIWLIWLAFDDSKWHGEKKPLAS